MNAQASEGSFGASSMIATLSDGQAVGLPIALGTGDEMLSLFGSSGRNQSGASTTGVAQSQPVAERSVKGLLPAGQSVGAVPDKLTVAHANVQAAPLQASGIRSFFQPFKMIHSTDSCNLVVADKLQQ